MIGHLAARVAMRGGRSTVVALQAAAPLAGKVLEGPLGPVLMLVGSAAGLLEGDETVAELVLEPGSSLEVRSTAATLAHPCPGGGSTVSSVNVAMGARSRLCWVPEPLVACGGCNHCAVASLAMEAGAAAVWYEACTLGRTGEAAGAVALRLDATLDGAPLLRDGLRVGGHIGLAGLGGSAAEICTSPAVLGGHRHTASVHLLGRPLPEGVAGEIPGVMPLAGPGATYRAVASGAAALARATAPVVAGFTAVLLETVPLVHSPPPGAEKEAFVHG